MRTLAELDQFPEETRVVGRLILAYGELEWTLSLCFSAILDDTSMTGRRDRAARVLYRARGEEHRIVLADALMRDKYRDAGLDPPYSEFIGDLRYCKLIRNQYAHCHWRVDENSKLTLFTFEDGAKKNDEFSMEAYEVNLALLKEQEAFFNFVWLGMMLLFRRYEHFSGRTTENLYNFPKKLPRPSLHLGAT